jgi:DNA-binding response OmpR family regulator
MIHRPKAAAFNLDADTLLGLQEALPDWEVEVVGGAATRSLDRDWGAGRADLLVVGARAEDGVILGLCRGLRRQAGRALTPLLVLVPAARQDLVQSALDAGADACLILPLRGADLVSAVVRARGANQPGRHTRRFERDQGRDHWRDDGGEA